MSSKNTARPVFLLFPLLRQSQVQTRSIPLKVNSPQYTPLHYPSRPIFPRTVRLQTLLNGTSCPAVIRWVMFLCMQLTLNIDLITWSVDISLYLSVTRSLHSYFTQSSAGLDTFRPKDSHTPTGLKAPVINVYSSGGSPKTGEFSTITMICIT